MADLTYLVAHQVLSRNHPPPSLSFGDFYGLSTRQVADLAKIPYTVTSQILIGKITDAERLALIERAIERAPMPARESLAAVLEEIMEGAA